MPQTPDACRFPRLAELPPPPAGRSGWPWTEESAGLPPTMPDGRPWPRISVTTPSYNQAAYLEETIRSVLLQGYPDLEYHVVDGGSTDGSVEVIRRYEAWLASWVSERDSGQSEAINKGWRRSEGELFAFLNSDDTYLPNALGGAARAWAHDPTVALVTGGYIGTNEHSIPGGRRLPTLPNPGPLDLTLLDHERWLLPQPSSFFVREYLDRVGRWVREDLQYTMDRELIYRIARAGRAVLIAEPLATYRIHTTSKTIAEQENVIGEARRSFAHCAWGGVEERGVRERICRWRIAQGYRVHAAHTPSMRAAVRAYARAARHRPGYLLDRRFLRQFAGAGVRLVLRGVRLYEPLRTLRDSLAGLGRPSAASERHA